MYRLRYDSRLLCIGTIRYGKSHIGIYIGIASNWVYCIVYIVGHTDFADYHERFQHDDAYLFCRCGARKAPYHFLFCPIAKRKARRPLGPPSQVIPYLLGSVKGAQKLATWLAETQFYTDICPRQPPP